MPARGLAGGAAGSDSILLKEWFLSGENHNVPDHVVANLRHAKR